MAVNISALGTRNATLAEMASLLQDQHSRRLDVVAPATAIRAEGGQLVIDGIGEPVLSMDGVTTGSGRYTPTDVCDQGIADKLGIPGAYLRRLHADHVDLYDANVNGWLARADRKFLVRNLFEEDRGSGLARAFLSDGYRIIDNLDVLMAALDGVRQAGVQVKIDGCDLTERRMYVRIVSEEVRALAPTLLRNYRSPFTGDRGADNPVVFAGFVVSNSETGCGAFTITPRVTVEVCRNGMTLTRDALRNVHLGGRLDEGLVQWSEDTQQRSLDLVAAKSRDAVATFLNADYLEAVVSEVEAGAGKPVTDPAGAVRVVSTRLKLPEDRQADILNHFIQGADATAGGVMQAVTSVAQTIRDADEAHDMESQALRALEIAASL